MRILGLDPSQSTGWALYDTTAHLSAIQAGVIRVSRAEGGYEVKAAELGRQVRAIIAAQRPDFVAVEQPLRQKPGAGKKKAKLRFSGDLVSAVDENDYDDDGGGGLNAVISSNQMVGAICGVIGVFGIPFATISVQTWRKMAYGPGSLGGRKQAKAKARELCRQHRIIATNDDMAEAVWIAFAGAGLPQAKMLGRAA